MMKGCHTIYVLGVQEGSLLYKNHQNWFPSINSCIVKWSLVLIVSLIDIGSGKDDLLETVHVVCYDGVKNRDLFTRIFLGVNRLHDLEDLVLLLNSQRGLMATVALKEIFNIIELQFDSKIHGISAFTILEP